MELCLYLCLLLCGICEPWAPWRPSVCQECECCVDGSMIYGDPCSRMAERLDHCCPTSSALLKLGVGCMCFGFKLRNSCLGSILLPGNAWLYFLVCMREQWEFLGDTSVSHTSISLEAHGSATQPGSCRTSKSSSPIYWGLIIFQILYPADFITVNPYPP